MFAFLVNQRRNTSPFVFTDDIIKLNKKEQKANRAKSKRASNRNNVLKKLNQVPQQQQRGLRRGEQQYQGKHLILDCLTLQLVTLTHLGNWHMTSAWPDL